MNIVWDEHAWKDFNELFLTHEKKTIERILLLIKDIERNGCFKGIGNPEPLKHELSGYWSRRITKEDRLVYCIDEKNVLHIIQCRTHYDS